MTRPTPKPIEWETSYDDCYSTALCAGPLDTHFFLCKNYDKRKDKYTYLVVDRRDCAFPKASRPTAAELVKFLVESCPFIGGPEVYAALASITSNEDWENLDA